MVHYHGGPFSDPLTAVVVWRGRHAMISFARPEQIKMAADICQSFCLDNGAYSAWRQKAKTNFDRYYSSTQARTPTGHRNSGRAAARSTPRL